MKSSLFAGSRSWQSASLPGRLAMSSAPLRRVRSRALRAALACGRRLDDLGYDLSGVGRMLLEPLRQLVADDAFDRRTNLGRDELVLGLRGEFRVRHH